MKLLDVVFQVQSGFALYFCTSGDVSLIAASILVTAAKLAEHPKAPTQHLSLVPYAGEALFCGILLCFLFALRSSAVILSSGAKVGHTVLHINHTDVELDTSNDPHSNLG